jgi:uncharacterized protein (DUF2062 family)
MRTIAEQARHLFRCRILRPLLRLLQTGADPRRLAWSLAIAIVIGINPLLGTTTVCMLLIAWVFQLNHVATQIGIHTVSPLQWLLFIPFVNLGIIVFRGRPLSMSKAEILRLSEHHPLRLIHLLWQWEWHALIIWAVFAAILAPILASQIRKALVLSMRRHKDLLKPEVCSLT